MIPIIDLFAGPGGLGEGFSSFDGPGYCPFRIGLSVEKDVHAHETLRLRSFYRQFSEGKVPDVYYRLLRQQIGLDDLLYHLAEERAHLSAWIRASSEAICAELGPSSHATIRKHINRALGHNRRRWVLIGGPPCQAYSLVGRVRRNKNRDYDLGKDARSKLYEEYLHIIAEHQPSIFVMENVTGMLSAAIDKKKVFERILSDLENPAGRGAGLRYRVVPIVATESRKYDDDDPRRFIVRCEEYGVPQQRHRVILVGLHQSLKDVEVPVLTPSKSPTVHSLLHSLPRLRSGLSRRRYGDGYVTISDDADSWVASIRRQVGLNGSTVSPRWLSQIDQAVRDKIVATAEHLSHPQKDRGAEFIEGADKLSEDHPLYRFLVDPELKGVCNHSSRAHMESDLPRYLFCAAFAKVHHRSPGLHEFPAGLLPQHGNVETGDFNDRFRVQLERQTATTITSHISKDGHYFIHYDPTQCRSLTVREAARLQTFPDNYYFCGPRTHQYTQVGNAVPPWIARQIAKSIWQTLVDAGKVT